jgi:hypothetical protein
VADRENGRIQRFNPDGRYLGSWSNLGKTFAISLGPNCLYIATQPRNLPNGSTGWLMKMDRYDGRVLGVVESTRHHGLAATSDGELLVGPGAHGPVWFRKAGTCPTWCSDLDRLLSRVRCSGEIRYN